MKYILNKDLPTFKAGTLATFNNWIFKSEDWKVIAHFSATDLGTHPNILTEWFEPIPEKRKPVPVVPDTVYSIAANWLIAMTEYGLSIWEQTVNQGNWRWTLEEAEAEVKKRAAIERVRRYLVENDLIEEDKTKFCYYIYVEDWNIWCESRWVCKFYSPYGRIKYINIANFIDDCRADLLLIHS